VRSVALDFEPHFAGRTWLGCSTAITIGRCHPNDDGGDGIWESVMRVPIVVRQKVQLFETHAKPDSFSRRSSLSWSLSRDRSCRSRVRHLENFGRKSRKRAWNTGRSSNSATTIGIYFVLTILPQALNLRLSKLCPKLLIKPRSA